MLSYNERERLGRVAYEAYNNSPAIDWPDLSRHSELGQKAWHRVAGAVVDAFHGGEQVNRIEYWRHRRDEAERGLYDAMVAELPIGCRVVYQDRPGSEITVEVIEHSATNPRLGVRDESGSEYWIDLSSVTGRAE